MLFNNSLNCIQPQARTLSNSLGGKKRLKDMGLNIGWNSGTVIANLINVLLIKSLSLDFPNGGPRCQRKDRG